MKDMVYRQKNIILDVVLLGIVIIVATCVIPITIIFDMSKILVYISLSLLVFVLILFLLIICKNTIGISNDGLILKKKKIFWKNILNIEIKIQMGKSIGVHYIFETIDCTINVYNNPELLNILLDYCNNNEKIKEILLQYKKEVEVQLGW